MTTLVLRNTTPTENRRLPKAYHSYIAIDKDRGESIADIKWTYRTKNAGGSAWQATMQLPGQPSGCVGTVVYSKELMKLCEIVRHCYTREGAAPSHWR